MKKKTIGYLFVVGYLFYWSQTKYFWLNLNSVCLLQDDILIFMNELFLKFQFFLSRFLVSFNNLRLPSFDLVIRLFCFSTIFLRFNHFIMNMFWVLLIMKRNDCWIPISIWMHDILCLTKLCYSLKGNFLKQVWLCSKLIRDQTKYCDFWLSFPWFICLLI